MKNLILFLALVITFGTGCGKDNLDNKNCTASTVNQTTGPCIAWGVTLEGTIYPADNLPDEYKIEGQAVCIEYEIIPAPPASCTCCRPRVRIISISKN